MERLKMPMVDIIEQQKEAIELEELNAQLTGKPKSDLLGRLYRVQSHMLFQNDKVEEAVKMADEGSSIFEAN